LGGNHSRYRDLLHFQFGLHHLNEQQYIERALWQIDQIVSRDSGSVINFRILDTLKEAINMSNFVDIWVALFIIAGGVQLQQF
jgi:hypothetical protein